MAKTVYQITAKEQKWWDKDNGVWVAVPLYTSLYPIWGVMIRDGKGITEDPKIALNFSEQNYTVTPDPHVTVQDMALDDLKENVRLGVQDENELERFKTDLKRWREKNNVAVPVKE